MDRIGHRRKFSQLFLRRCLEERNHSLQVRHRPSSFSDDDDDDSYRSRLMNKLEPNSIRKYYTDGGGFRSRENISLFRQFSVMPSDLVRRRFDLENAARAYGLKDLSLFQTVDLYEKRNIAQVTDCIFALAREVKQGRDALFSSIIDLRLFRRNERTSLVRFFVVKCPKLVPWNCRRNNCSLERV